MDQSPPYIDHDSKEQVFLRNTHEQPKLVSKSGRPFKLVLILLLILIGWYRAGLHLNADLELHHDNVHEDIEFEQVSPYFKLCFTLYSTKFRLNQVRSWNGIHAVKEGFAHVSLCPWITIDR